MERSKRHVLVDYRKQQLVGYGFWIGSMVLYRRFSKDSNMVVYGIFGALSGMTSYVAAGFFANNSLEIAAMINNDNERNH